MTRQMIGPVLVLAGVVGWVYWGDPGLGRPFSMGGLGISSPPAPREVERTSNVEPLIPVDPVGEAFFDEGARLFRLAREATGDDLSFDVTLEPGLVIELDVAYGLARRTLERALARGFRTDDCHALMARCLMGSGGGVGDARTSSPREKALRHARACRLTALTDPESLLALAESLEALDDATGALVAYEACARLAPLDGRAHLGAALTCLRRGLGDPGQLARHYEALARTPDLLERLRRALGSGPPADDPADLMGEVPPAALTSTSHGPPTVWLSPALTPGPDGAVEVPVRLYLDPPQSASEIGAALPDLLPDGSGLGHSIVIKTFHIIDLGRAGFRGLTIDLHGMPDGDSPWGGLLVHTATNPAGPWSDGTFLPVTTLVCVTHSCKGLQPFRFVRFAAADWSGHYRQSSVYVDKIVAMRDELGLDCDDLDIDDPFSPGTLRLDPSAQCDDLGL